MVSLRTLTEDCLDKDGTISIREDVMGVYGDDNRKDRSVIEQVERIQNNPFVRVAIVTIRPTGSTAGQYEHLQRDIDDATGLLQRECDAWVYPVASSVERTNILGPDRKLDQADCVGPNDPYRHKVSDEEDELFDLGRDLGADIVCYCIGGDENTSSAYGCAAYPSGRGQNDPRPGFWIAEDPGQLAFAHELVHIVGENAHTYGENSEGNLMHDDIDKMGPGLTDDQCNRFLNDKHIERCYENG